jgi:hypothetical protein
MVIMEKGLVKTDGSLDTIGKTLKDFGINVKNANGSLKDQTTLIGEISQKYNSFSTQQERVNFLTEVFGKSGAGLVDFFDTLAQEGGIDAARKKVEAFGLVLDPGRMEQFGRAIEELKMIGLGLAVSFTEKVMPALEGFLKLAGDFLSGDWKAAKLDLSAIGQAIQDALSTEIDRAAKWIENLDPVAITNALTNFIANGFGKAARRVDPRKTLFQLKNMDKPAPALLTSVQRFVDAIVDLIGRIGWDKVGDALSKQFDIQVAKAGETIKGLPGWAKWSLGITGALVGLVSASNFIAALSIAGTSLASSLGLASVASTSLAFALISLSSIAQWAVTKWIIFSVGMSGFVVGAGAVVIALLTIGTAIALWAGIIIYVSAHWNELVAEVNQGIAIMKFAFSSWENYLKAFDTFWGTNLSGMWDKLQKFGADVGGWVNKVIAWFMYLKDMLVGHSIIPDTVNAIISIMGIGLITLSLLVDALLRQIAKVFFTRALGWAQQMIAGFLSGLPGLLGVVSGLVGQINGILKKIITRFDVTVTVSSVGTSGGRSTAPQHPFPATPGTKASGGPVFAGQTYRWNERGQEFFTPAMNGTIIPAGMNNSEVTLSRKSVDELSEATAFRLAPALVRAMNNH